MTAKQRKGLWLILEGVDSYICNNSKALEEEVTYLVSLNSPFVVYDLWTAKTVDVKVDTKVTLEYPASDEG